MQMKWFNTKRGLQVIPEFYLFVEHFRYATSLSTHFTDNACQLRTLILLKKWKRRYKLCKKCIRFYLRLDKMPTSKKVIQCINTITFEFVNNTCPYYLNEIFEFTPHCRIDRRNKLAKLEILFRKTNMGQKSISFVDPSLWSSSPQLIKSE